MRPQSTEPEIGRTLTSSSISPSINSVTLGAQAGFQQTRLLDDRAGQRNHAADIQHAVGQKAIRSRKHLDS